MCGDNRREMWRIWRDGKRAPPASRQLPSKRPATALLRPSPTKYLHHDGRRTPILAYSILQGMLSLSLLLLYTALYIYVNMAHVGDFYLP